jgi:hypothetical protein
MQPDKPAVLAPNLDNIPAALRGLRQFVCWRYDWDEKRGEWAKVPYSPAGFRASSTNPAHWRTFEEACAAYQHGGFEGIGFVFAAGGGIVGIDLDHVVDPETSKIAKWADQAINDFATYTEYSVSGTGVHMLIFGSFPENSRKRAGQVEIYQSARFFTLTGQTLFDCDVQPRQGELDSLRKSIFPAEVPDERKASTGTLSVKDADVLKALRQSTSGPAFDKLYSGDASDYVSETGQIDDSAADYGLIGFFKMVTKDAEQIARLMRSSGMERDKWDEKRPGGNWLTYTIARSLASGESHTLGQEIHLNGHANGVATAIPPKVEDDEEEATEEAEPPKPRYTLHHVSEAFEPQEPIPWVVEGMLTKGSVSLFVGSGGSKKTYTLLDMAVSVALGEPWLDFETVQGPVLVIDEESGNRRLKLRLAEVMRNHEAGPLTPIWYTTIEGFNLRLVSDVAAVRDLIRATRPTLVILDALVDLMPGADENAAQDVHPVFQALRSLAEEFACAIVVIHHANKNGSYRGSTSMQGAVDLLMMVKSAPKEPVVMFESEKARDTEPLNFSAFAEWNSLKATFALKSTKGDGPRVRFNKGELEVLRRLAKAEGHRLLLSYMTDHAETVSDISVRKAVRSLAERGYCRRCDAGGRGEKAEYALTSQTTTDELKKLGVLK